jgi:hypothetical protein
MTINRLHIFILSLLLSSLGYSSADAQPAAQEKEQQATANTSSDNQIGKPWIKMSPSGAGATFEMPNKPRYVERQFPPVQDKPPVKVRLHLCTVNEGTTTFIFGYHDLHEEPADNKTINATLDGAVRGSVANVFGQLAGRPTPIRFKKALGRQFVYRYQQARPKSDGTEQKDIYVVTARVFLMGKRQYQVNCLMKQSIFDEQLAAKFLNSLTILDPPKDLPPLPQNDK